MDDVDQVPYRGATRNIPTVRDMINTAMRHGRDPPRFRQKGFGNQQETNMNGIPLIFTYPFHKRDVRKAIREECPGLFVEASHYSVNWRLLCSQCYCVVIRECDDEGNAYVSIETENNMHNFFTPLNPNEDCTVTIQIYQNSA